jgi:hypothetical protein
MHFDETRIQAPRSDDDNDYDSNNSDYGGWASRGRPREASARFSGSTGNINVSDMISFREIVR